MRPSRRYSIGNGPGAAEPTASTNFVKTWSGAPWIGFPATESTTSPAFRPACAAGEPLTTWAILARTFAPKSGRSPTYAEVVLRARPGRHPEGDGLAAAIDFDVQGLAGVHPEDEEHVAPPRRRSAVDRDDPVAGPEAGLGPGRIRLDDADDRRLELVGRHARADGEDHGVQKESEDEVHQRAREQHERALPALADRGRLPRCPLRDRGLVRPEADDADVAAERYGRNAVVRSAPLASEQALAEPDREDLDGEPEELGHGEVPELVNDHEHREHDDQGEDVGQNVQGGSFESDSNLSCRGFRDYVATAGARRRTIAEAASRAPRSTASASSRSRGAGVEPVVSMVPATTLTMSGKEIFPSRNAATATSLAAFRTAGMPPPAASAWRASGRAG